MEEIPREHWNQVATKGDLHVLLLRLETVRQRRLTVLTVRVFWGITIALGLAAVALNVFAAAIGK